MRHLGKNIISALYRMHSMRVLYTSRRYFFHSRVPTNLSEISSCAVSSGSKQQSVSETSGLLFATFCGVASTFFALKMCAEPGEMEQFDSIRAAAVAQSRNISHGLPNHFRSERHFIEVMRERLKSSRRSIGISEAASKLHPALPKLMTTRHTNKFNVIIELPLMNLEHILASVFDGSAMCEGVTPSEKVIASLISCVDGEIAVADTHRVFVRGKFKETAILIELNSLTRQLKWVLPKDSDSSSVSIPMEFMEELLNVYFTEIEHARLFPVLNTEDPTYALLELFKQDHPKHSFANWISKNRSTLRREWFWWNSQVLAIDHLISKNLPRAAAPSLDSLSWKKFRADTLPSVLHKVQSFHDDHDPHDAVTWLQKWPERLLWLKRRFAAWMLLCYEQQTHEYGRPASVIVNSAVQTKGIDDGRFSLYFPDTPTASMQQLMREYHAAFARSGLGSFGDVLAEKKIAANTTKRVLRSSTDPTEITHLEGLPCEVYSRASHAIDGVSWANLAGYDYIREIVEENILLPRRYTDIFERVTASTREQPQQTSVRAGCYVFYGPPGTGKTTTARIIASLIDVPMVCLSFESIASKYYGEPQKMLDKILKQISQLPEGAVVFIDEAETFFPSRKRANMGNTDEYDKRLLSIFLKWLEGIQQNEKVVAVLATNREDALDEALVSRTSLAVHFRVPDRKARAAIWKRYAKQLDASDLDQVVAASEGLTARDVVKICEVAERRHSAKIVRSRDQSRNANLNTNAWAPPLNEYLNAISTRMATHRDPSHGSAGPTTV